jgi:hypothetical protein
MGLNIAYDPLNSWVCILTRKEKNLPSYPHNQLLFTADVVARKENLRVTVIQRLIRKARAHLGGCAAFRQPSR